MAIGQSDYQVLIAAHPAGTLLALGSELEAIWCEDYRRTHGSAELGFVNQSDHGATFTYILDTARSRVVGVYGMPIYYGAQRDYSRQGGHPLGSTDNKKYVRGHLIAHIFGGGMDINFVPQLKSTNGSAFKKVENEVRALALANDRCLYFVRAVYAASPAGGAPNKAIQMPVKLEQGVIRISGQLTYRMHDNV